MLTTGKPSFERGTIRASTFRLDEPANQPAWRESYVHRSSEEDWDGISCRLSPETLDAIERSSPRDRELIFGGLLTYNSFATIFRRIVKRAGLKGWSKWLRRSAATAIEAAHPGAATAFLGHRTADLAMRDYVDRAQIQYMKPTPPPLPPAESLIKGNQE